MTMDQAALEKQLGNIFARVNPDKVTEREIAHLGKEIGTLGPEVLPILLSYINHFDENLRTLAGTVLILLGKRELGERLKESLFQVLEDPNRPKEEKYNAIFILSCIQGYDIDYDRLLWSVTKPEMLQQKIQDMLGKAARGDELDCWRKELLEMTLDSQFFCLRNLLDRHTPQVLPLLSVALDLGSKEVSLFVAEGLRSIPSQETLGLLSNLIRDKDPSVRRKARQTISCLGSQGVDISSIFLLGNQ